MWKQTKTLWWENTLLGEVCLSAWGQLFECIMGIMGLRIKPLHCPDQSTSMKNRRNELNTLDKSISPKSSHNLPQPWFKVSLECTSRNSECWSLIHSHVSGYIDKHFSSLATSKNITRGVMVVVVVTGQVMVWPGDALGPYDHLLPTDQWPLALGSPHSPHHIIIWSMVILVILAFSFSTSAGKGFPMTCSHCTFYGLPPLDV